MLLVCNYFFEISKRVPSVRVVSHKKILKWIKTIDSHIFVLIDGKYLWVFKLLGTGRDDGVLQFDGHECTNETMVDSNEMFVNEAIHQGTDMRHPMCPNAIFRIPKKGHKNSCCCSSSFLWGENNSHEYTPLPMGLRKCPNIESTYYYYSIYCVVVPTFAIRVYYI